MYGMMTQEEALRKLQGIELEIMLSVGELCRENDITWFMDSGTALGAMRHQGFIPWDDDVDVGMLRPDYDRFVEAASRGMGGGCTLHTSGNTHGFAPLFAKVFRDGTRFETLETREAGLEQGIFVDVFPYDRLYVDPELLRRQISNASMAQKRSYLYHAHSITVPHRGALGTVERAGCLVAHGVEHLVVHDPADYQMRFNQSIPNSEKGEVSDLCLSLAWPNMEPIKTGTLVPTATATFEGHDLPVPGATDEYLTFMYGDWRQIPAPEDRHTHLPLLLDFGDGSVWKAGE